MNNRLDCRRWSASIASDAAFRRLAQTVFPQLSRAFTEQSRGCSTSLAKPLAPAWCHRNNDASDVTAAGAACLAGGLGCLADVRHSSFCLTSARRTVEARMAGRVADLPGAAHLT